MNGWALRELLRGGPVLADGGMGTSLMDRGVPAGTCFDALSLEDPELVLEVHRAFVDAGSTFLTSNTFGANRYRLAPHGHERRVGELNRAGVELARKAGAMVAGSIGPLGVRLAPYGRVSAVEAEAAFREQVEGLAEAGADVLLIETHSDLAEIEQAVAAARGVGDTAVIVTAAFARDDRTLLGHTAEQVAERLAALGVDAIGVNCSEGPAQVLRLIEAMRPIVGDTPLVAQPNAGGPAQVGGRYLYPATPDYMADHASALLASGVSFLGGCCGTGPAHVAAMAGAIDAHEPVSAATPVLEPDEREAEHTMADAPTQLARALSAGRFTIAVEMDPPRGFSAAKMLAGAQTLAEAGADVIDVADSPMARMRMSPWAACRLIQDHGIETILHFPTRGRNLLRLQGDLLAVHALGIRNLFVCMGDPVAIGDYPGATDNVDVVPTGLMKLITEGFNRGKDRAGASIGEPTSFVVGCAVSPSAADLHKEVRLLKKKVDAGCVFALSQPAYTLEPLRALHRAYEEAFGPLEMPILAGVLPLAGARHAEFLHNEVPGIVVPDAVRERLHAANDDEAAQAEGLAMARDLVGELADPSATQGMAIAGIYLMPPFGRYDLAAEVVESARAAAPSP